MKNTQGKLLIVLIIGILLLAGFYSFCFFSKTPREAGEKTLIVGDQRSSLTIRQLLDIAKGCCDILPENNDTVFGINPVTLKYNGFNFFKKAPVINDSFNVLKKYAYFNYLATNKIWSVESADLKYSYRYYFYDTTDVSIGICYVSFFDPSSNMNVTRKAPGFIALFKDVKESYFIGLLNNSFLFYKITTIQYLNNDMIPITQIRFGRQPAKPNVPEFISKFNYTDKGEYVNEIRFRCENSPDVLLDDALFFNTVNCLKLKGNIFEVGIVSASAEHSNMLPWFWSSTSIYDWK